MKNLVSILATLLFMGNAFGAIDCPNNKNALIGFNEKLSAYQVELLGEIILGEIESIKTTRLASGELLLIKFDPRSLSPIAESLITDVLLPQKLITLECNQNIILF